MSAPLPRLFPISSTWDQTLIEEEERWDPGNILAYSKYPKQLQNILGDNLVSTWSLTWNISIIQYFFRLIHLIARVRRKKILILMSCLVLEGNMILISGVSGASPTSLLSVNFLSGSWPGKEFTLSSETSAVSSSEPGMNVKEVLLDLCIFRRKVIWQFLFNFPWAYMGKRSSFLRYNFLLNLTAVFSWKGPVALAIREQGWLIHNCATSHNQRQPPSSILSLHNFPIIL